jgi:hypothetical protein
MRWKGDLFDKATPPPLALARWWPPCEQCGTTAIATERSFNMATHPLANKQNKTTLRLCDPCFLGWVEATTQQQEEST